MALQQRLTELAQAIATDIADLRNGQAVYYEPLLASATGNLDVVYQSGSNPVPDFMLSSSGDLIMGRGH